MFEPLAVQLLIGLYILMIMIEPSVVPFIWLILCLLIVIHDADQQEDSTHHQ